MDEIAFDAGPMSEQEMQEFLTEILLAYRKTGSLNQTAAIVEEKTGRKIGYHQVRKILITLGAYENRKSRQIRTLRENGLTLEKISELLQMSQVSVISYTPYEKGIYLWPEKDLKNLRSALNREIEGQEKQQEITIESLWQSMVEHQGEPFGKQGFRYTVRENVLLVEGRKRPIPKTAVAKVLEQMKEYPQFVTNCKRLRTEGAEYIWAILEQLKK